MKNLNISLGVSVGLGLFYSPFSSLSAKEQGKKMNIVFLLADDLRWNSIGCFGNDVVHTPNLDRLAEAGVKFENTYVTTPISMVSRASILTGQYMSRHGINRFSKEIDEGSFADTYPSVLRRNGYYTGFVGKYGVGKIREDDFDYVNSYEGLHWMPLNGARINVLGKDENGLLYTKIQGDSIHVTDKNLNDAINFLENRPTDKPFCLSVSFFATHAQDNHHDQYRYKPSSEKYYQDIEIPMPVTSTPQHYYSLPPFIANEKCESRVRWHWRFDSPEKYQKYMKAYYRMVTEIDLAVGEIIEKLKEQGELDNTLIIFTGDNGYFQSDFQIADKWYAYEQSIRVPLIVFDPRIPAGRRGVSYEEIALNIDIAPTLVSASGSPVPNVMQGEDLSTIYLKKKHPRRDDFFFEHPFINNEEFIPSSQAVISIQEKYILYPHYGFQQYFDLRKDPLETDNAFLRLKDSRKMKKLKKRFQELKTMAK